MRHPSASQRKASCSPSQRACSRCPLCPRVQERILPSPNHTPVGAGGIKNAILLQRRVQNTPHHAATSPLFRPGLRSSLIVNPRRSPHTFGLGRRHPSIPFTKRLWPQHEPSFFHPRAACSATMVILQQRVSQSCRSFVTSCGVKASRTREAMRASHHARLSPTGIGSAVFSSPPSSSVSKHRARQLGQLAFTANQLSAH